MKILLRIICCILVAVAILWWRPGPASFAQRLVAMPATMSWEPRHESFGASFVLHAAQMPGELRLVCAGWGRQQWRPFLLLLRISWRVRMEQGTLTSIKVQ